MCFQETNVNKCHHLGNETFTKKQLERTWSNTQREQWSLLQPPLWHSQAKKTSLPARNRHCRTFVTCSNCILRDESCLPPKKTPLKTNMTMEKNNRLEMYLYLLLKMVLVFGDVHLRQTSSCSTKWKGHGQEIWWDFEHENSRKSLRLTLQQIL